MNYWIYFAVFLIGIIAGLLIYMKMKSPDQVINENQRIGKIKNTGDNSNQNTTLVRDLMDGTSIPIPAPSLLEKILPGRQARKNVRLERRRVRREAKLNSPHPP